MGNFHDGPILIRKGGFIFIDFDTPLTSFGFDIIDIEENELEDSHVRFSLDGELLASVFVSEFITSSATVFDSSVEFGNNSANRIQPLSFFHLGQPLQFDEVKFVFTGSGAIDNLTFTPIPGPGMPALIGVAALVIRPTRRRRVPTEA